MKTLILLSLMISACSTTGNYKRRCDAFVGKSVSDLVDQWGEPNERKENSAGQTLITFARTTGPYTKGFYGGGQFTSQVREDTCVTTFVAGPDQIIISWRLAGNKCKSN